MMDKKELLEHLCLSLPFIARITGGYATVTDRLGRRLKNVDSHGREISKYQGEVYDIARQAGEKQMPVMGPSQFVENAEAWAMPIGDYVLCCSNVERVERDSRLREALSQALPMIARVAGGDAVLFDHRGVRLETADHTGKRSEKLIGKISQAAYEAIVTQKPVIGESIAMQGVTAVRIPITEKYGLGFNNEVMVSQKQKLLDEVKKFQYARYSLADIIGESEAVQKCKTIVQYVAQGVSSVLVYGATGTGKELFAQAIHNTSDRRNRPFIAVNCGALPSSLIEANLFGYVDGSFTGAKKNGNTGVFEAADGGTVFLDEISEMDWDLQAKLLRVLQEREVTRIGSTKPIPVNVRIISSTNKDLVQLIEEKRFREDLYYRINVIELRVPCLKERTKDIPLLTNYFIVKYNPLLGKNISQVAQAVYDIFQSYPWSGNIRELQNCIESALNMVHAEERTLEVHHLPSKFCNSLADRSIPPISLEDNLAMALQEAEKQVILRVLQQERNNRYRTAGRLGISCTTLWRKMRENNLLAT
ncbi:sigma-54 interaction domain-containing protein [Sporomusa aerivorans]|uniref:sigma-54 interaction domain-containing protein n=1 Tax=Sporomusa aerivorans TaxID=204936 RepID=UPI00352A15A7